MVSLSDKRVLITGVDGFTGQALSKHLHADGAIVYGTSYKEAVTDDSRVKDFILDIRDAAALKSVIEEVQPEFIFHFAAISFVGSGNKSAFYDVNVLGSENLLEAAVTLESPPQKIILASSATVYGSQETNVLQEDLCPNPVNHYGMSKLAMEQVARTYFSKLPIIITRPFNYTGPGQAEHFLIPKIVSHYKRREKDIELGNLDVAREFNDIRDVVEIYRSLMVSAGKSEIVNIASGRPVQLLNIIEEMNKLAGYEIEVKVNPVFVRANEIKELTGSTEKLSRISGVTFKYDLYDLLKSLYEA